jgi:uncharacterized ion transporter superfamily protein YfcC
MNANQKDYQVAYRILMLVVAVAMFGWAIPAGIANYKFDQCSQNLQVRLDKVKARIDGAKSSVK